MLDPFFASQKPRKRKRTTAGPSSSGGRPSKTALTGKGQTAPANPKRKARDEELASDATDDDVAMDAIDDMDLRAEEPDPGASEEEDEAEAPAEKRLRLARLYLDSIKEGLAEGEYDAAEVDRELISARLKQDVQEHAGKVHLHIADTLDLSGPTSSVHRVQGHRFTVTAAVASEDARTLFTSGKEGSIVRWDLRTGKRVATFTKVRPPTNAKGKGRAQEVEGHTDEVWALALSSDGRYLASGGKDRRIGVWDVSGEGGTWVKSFGGHKDSITTLVFRKGTLQLYSAGLDRTLRLHDLGVMAFVEALFGHQDAVYDLDALRAETAISVGARDRTARFWKVADETQLVFRGGGRSKVRDLLEGGALDGIEGEGEEGQKQKIETKRFIEGSLECVAMIDESTFVTGGDSGSISLWTTQKKKPVFTQPVAHGFNEVQSATEGIIRTPRYVTALAALRYSDLFASGSWEGTVRLWKLETPRLRAFELVGKIPAPGIVNALQLLSVPSGALSGATWVAGEGADADLHGATRASARAKDRATTAMLAMALGQEPSLGRWMTLKEGVRNEARVVVLHPRTA